MNIEAHLAELEVAGAAPLRHLVARLRTLPEVEPSTDLPERIMRAVAQERRGRPLPRMVWRMAQVVAAVVLAAITLIYCQSYFGGSSNRHLVWLAAQQQADGSWEPARHGAAPVYRPALTALALMALSKEHEQYAAQINKAAQALCAMQTPDGAFGGHGRAASYNQAMAVCALAALPWSGNAARADSTPHATVVQETLTRSVAYSSRTQSAQGGWDYEEHSEGNAALTAWQVRALAAAAQHGVAQADIPLRKGLRWLCAATRDDGSVAYHRASFGHSECLTALAAYSLMTAGKPYSGLPELGRKMVGALATGDTNTADCYRDYAKCLALSAAGARQQAATLRNVMQKHIDTGTPDQWSQVGGTLYAHALAAQID